MVVKFRWDCRTCTYVGTAGLVHMLGLPIWYIRCVGTSCEGFEGFNKGELPHIKPRYCEKFLEVTSTPAHAQSNL